MSKRSGKIEGGRSAKVLLAAFATVLAVLALVPNSLFEGSRVLLRLASAAKSDTGMALVVIGTILYFVTQPVMLELKRALNIFRAAALKDDKAKVELAKIYTRWRLATAGVWAGLLLCASGIALVTVRAVVIDSSMVLNKQFEDKLNRLKTSVPKNDQSPGQYVLPAWSNRCKSAADEMDEFLVRHADRLPHESMARGLALLGAQWVNLGDYARVEEVLSMFKTLTDQESRFRAQADALYVHYYLVHLAREGKRIGAIPRQGELNDRLELLVEIQAAYLQGNFQSVFDSAQKYIQRFEWDAEDAGRWNRLVLLAQAHAWLITVVAPNTSIENDMIEHHVRKALELVELVRASSEVEFISRCDIDRVEIQCQVALAGVRLHSNDFLGAAREYEYAVDGLHRLIVNYRVTGQREQFVMISDQLVSVYQALGKSASVEHVRKRQQEVASACSTANSKAPALSLIGDYMPSFSQISAAIWTVVIARLLLSGRSAPSQDKEHQEEEIVLKAA